MDSTTKRPLERIEELLREVAEKRMSSEQAALDSDDMAKFLLSILGDNRADRAEQLLKDPWTAIAAIMAYLEEDFDRRNLR